MESAAGNAFRHISGLALFKAMIGSTSGEQLWECAEIAPAVGKWQRSLGALCRSSSPAMRLGASHFPPENLLEIMKPLHTKIDFFLIEIELIFQLINILHT